MPQQYQLTAKQKTGLGVVSFFLSWPVLILLAFLLSGATKYASWIIHNETGISYHWLYRQAMSWQGSRLAMFVLWIGISIGVYYIGRWTISKRI